MQAALDAVQARSRGSSEPGAGAKAMTASADARRCHARMVEWRHRYIEVSALLLKSSGQRRSQKESGLAMVLHDPLWSESTVRLHRTWTMTLWHYALQDASSKECHHLN